MAKKDKSTPLKPKDSVLIFTDGIVSPQKRGGNTPAALGRKAVANVFVDDLQKEATDFYNKVVRIFDKLDAVGNNYELNEIEIGAEISADGKIGFLGSQIGVGAKGSISFKLVKKTKE